MKTLQSLLAITLFLLCRTVTGIEVVADSSCAAACVDSIRSNYSDPNSSRTKHSDLFCVDSHYPGGSEQDSGASDWRYCLTCEASSPAYAPGIHNDTELDVQMFLCKSHGVGGREGLACGPCPRRWLFVVFGQIIWGWISPGVYMDSTVTISTTLTMRTRNAVLLVFLFTSPLLTKSSSGRPTSGMIIATILTRPLSTISSLAGPVWRTRGISP